jgi:hypothetical protein
MDGLVKCVMLFELSDYLEIPTLRQASVQVLRDFLRILVLVLQAVYGHPVCRSEFNNTFFACEAFIDVCYGRRDPANPLEEAKSNPDAGMFRMMVIGIERAFRQGANGSEVQQAFVDMVEASHFHFIHWAVVLGVFDHAPHFGTAVLKRLLGTGATLPWTVNSGEAQSACASCGSVVFVNVEDGDRAVEAAIKSGHYWAPMQRGDPKLYCTRCEDPIL